MKVGKHGEIIIRLLLGLEVVEQNATLLALLTPVADDDAGAVHDLAGVAFTINLAYNTQKISLNSLNNPRSSDSASYQAPKPPQDNGVG